MLTEINANLGSTKAFIVTLRSAHSLLPDHANTRVGRPLAPRLSPRSEDPCQRAPGTVPAVAGPENSHRGQAMAEDFCIENRTFDEIAIGDEARLSRSLTWRDIELFAAMSGDVNPAHVDEEFAKSDMFHKIIAHGMWGGALISTVLGTELPGPGTIYVSQSLNFQRPICLGDSVTVTVRAVDRNRTKRRVTFECNVVNQDSKVVITGRAEVVAPTEKVCRQRMPVPQVELREPDRTRSVGSATVRNP